MSKHTLTIELAKPLEWVRVEKEVDIKGLRDYAIYVIRKDQREFVARLNRFSTCSGLKQFHRLMAAAHRGPSGHFPFEVALIETPPWPIVHKDADGWIDLEKTPAGLLGHAKNYELRGEWAGSAWAMWHEDRKVWKNLGSCPELPAPYNEPTKVRPCKQGFPKEWLHGPPSKPEKTREERLEKKVKELEAKLARAAAALGEGGGE